MNYIGIDGNIHSDELKHWKYIKKIKSGSGWRYFYTPEEVRAFYKESKQENAQTHQKNLKNISDSYNRSMDQAKNRTMTFDYKNNKWRNLNKKEIENHRKNYAEPERRKALRKETARNKIGTVSNLSKKLTKEPRKDIKKIQKNIQIETEGTKRAAKNIINSKGDSYATPDHTLVKKQTIYSKNANTYKTKTTKSSDWGLGPNRVSYSKSNKTGSAEKLLVKSYRTVLRADKKAKNKVSKGKTKVEKMLAPTSGGTQKSKTLSQTIGKTKRNNKPRVTKTENGTLTSRTLKETVNGKTTVNRPYTPSEKEKKYIKRYKKKARKDSSAGRYKQKTLRETIR